MLYSVNSPIKINLILKIMDKKENGYHEIFSIFWQKKSAEKLTIETKYGEIIGDSLIVEGTEIIGENLVTKALKAARRTCPHIPPLKIKLEKEFPAGSGIGAGSGNAGALLRWLGETFGMETTAGLAAKLGADVAFLASENIMAEAKGIGEIITPLEPQFDFRWLIVFPKWRSDTKEAYEKLDCKRAGQICENTSRSIETIKKESAVCIARLAAGEKVGLLPNDFFSLLSDEHAEYREAERIADETSASGWGLCGSGSAFFALYKNTGAAADAAKIFSGKPWVLKTYNLE